MEFITNAVTICALITGIATIVNVFAVWATKAREPEKKQIERIVALETKIDSIEEHLNNDKKRLTQLDEGEHITQKALLALTSHALNGNNTDQLKEARAGLEKYLIER